PRAKPGVRIRYRIHGLLVFPGLVGAELLPCEVRKRVVLDSVTAAHRVGGSEVERAEVDRVVGRGIDAVKRDTNETPLREVLATDVELDRAGRELDPRQECNRFTGRLAQPNAVSGAVHKAHDVAVEKLQSFLIDQGAEIGRDCLRLA